MSQPPQDLTKEQIIEGLTKLDQYGIIYVCEWLFKNHPHKYDYATMCEPLRRFHDPQAKRPG